MSAAVPAIVRARHRAAWIGVVTLSVFALLLGKLFWLHLVEGPRLKAVYEQQQMRPMPQTLVPVSLKAPLSEKPARGAILDRKGRVLAASYFVHRLYCDPSVWDHDAGQLDAIVAELPDILKAEGVRIDSGKLGPKLLRSRLDDGRRIREVLLASNVTPAARRRLAETFRDAKWSGLYFRDLVAREYPFGEAVAQVVGVVAESDEDSDGTVSGRTGLEWQLDALLTGRRGALAGERDSMGRDIRFEDVFAIPPVGGAEVHLTIDAEISRFCLEALARNAKPNPCVRSSAVVLSAKTGEVLAAVSYPASPPGGPGFEARNLALAAVGDSYEPGSTMKPFMVSWALETGVIREDQVFDCGGPSGATMFFNRSVTEYSVNPEPLTPAQVLWRSSNIGATRIGLERLKLAGMFEALRAFRIAERPKSGLPNEAAGFYTPQRGDPDRGLQGATESGAGVSFPRGYEIRLSPLALAVGYTTFATGGDRLSATVLKEILVAGRTIAAPPSPRVHVLSPASCNYVREAMLQAYENPRGTAYSSARSARYSAMGKTGTAQYMDKHVARGQQYNAWIVGMAPAMDLDDHTKTRDPEIVAVVVHHRVAARGTGTYTGGVVSGPVVKEIVERTLEYLGVEPDQPGPPPSEEEGR
jgi:cell division protein FtsI (penicillin-binding protein 3)